jgi:predicted GTPase
MIILDKPYISDFLLRTLEKNKTQVILNRDVAELTKGWDLNVISKDAAIQQFTGMSTPTLHQFRKFDKLDRE